MADNFTVELPPDSWLPNATNGPAQACIATYDLPYMAFDDSTKETAFSKIIRCPSGYTGSGTLKADIDYIMATATSGTVDWEVSVQAVTPGDSLDMDAGESYDTLNSNSGTVPGTAGYPQRITVTLTNKDSIAAGDLVRLKLARDAADGTNDTATGDARVLCVTLREEV